MLLAPTVMMAILGMRGATVDPAFILRFRPVLFLVGLVAGFFEEVGCTGIPAPRMLEQQTPSRAGFSSA
jgi:hypothetical protein